MEVKLERTTNNKKESVCIECIIRAFLFLVISIIPNISYAADDSLCARVKLEIKQELTLERQAFDAHMRINNGLSHITLEDIGVDVSFADEEGSPVLAGSDPDNTDALFYIRIDTMDNIENVDGAGTVPPSSSADIHWLIIPAPGASNGVPQGTLYYVGATLTYTIGGEEHVTEVTPDYIFVKPMPELTLDYFIPSDVYGDDAFTTEVEPAIPFYLGVRVGNNGTGVAKALKIDSAQPKIIENDLGLLINFAIEGCEVNGQPASTSLLADFGDIDPGTAGIARWIMTCTLSGEFVEFTAEYSHSDELGGELTSLLKETNTHFLIHDVLADVSGKDNIRDFLAKDGDVCRLYESENIDTNVTDQSSSSSLNGSGYVYTLTTPVTAGYMYVKLADPASGTKVIDEVVRSDGKYIKSANAWLSKERDENNDWLYYINLFDANTTSTYTVRFEDEAQQPHAPVLQFIPDRTVVEGAQVSFIVEASDADGTIPSLSTSSLPALASFDDEGTGTAIFDWTPSVGQAGIYEITYTATDGALEDTQKANIQVISSGDTDGDGMEDSWEMEHFGTLDRDGTGDFDGDGITDLDEYLNNTDPVVANQAPSIPVIVSPAVSTEITALQADLVIDNSSDPDNDPLTYTFELYSDEVFVNLIAGEAGVETTSWAIPFDLNDNTHYYWRVQASDGFAYSNWAYGSFFVNTANDYPGVFFPTSPVEFDTSTPQLEVTNSVDIDGDTLTYAFEVYSDSSLTTLVVSDANIPQGTEGATSWAVDTPLSNNTDYYWKAIATDEHGLSTETDSATFLIYIENTPPSVPAISFPETGAEVTAQDIDLTVINATDIDEDDISYFFEIDKVDTFDSADLVTSGEVLEGTTTTSWQVTALDDNTLYYWRVKASDGFADSTWVTGSFFVNTANDAPTTPTLRNPANEAWVDTLTPMLEVNASIDADNDGITYAFEVYADADIAMLVAQDQVEAASWTVPVSLSDNTFYYWRARAVDEHGLSSTWMNLSSFFVNNDNIDNEPSITVVEPSQDIYTNGNSFEITWTDQDPDSDAAISLYYDTDSLGEDGTLIADGIQEDLDGEGDTYLWDISALPDGTYYIYANITDDHSSAYGYSAYSITIDRTNPTVEASPAGGSYDTAQIITLASDEPGEIYYTLDDTDPDITSPVYTGPITVDANVTLKFMSVDSAGNTSDIGSETYTISIVPQDIEVTVLSDPGVALSDVRVYAFSGSGVYAGLNVLSDTDGKAVFNHESFDDGEYKFRVDYLGSHFWSETITFPAANTAEVLIDHETVDIAVNTPGGPQQGVLVYVFSDAGAYMGFNAQTDETGVASFELPEGMNFMFRADYMGTQYWSDAGTVTSGEVNSITVDTGGGMLQVNVIKGLDEPMSGLNVYIFSSAGAYRGLYGTTDESGLKGFYVPEASYKVRVDYQGAFFWSESVTVIDDTNIEVMIPHQDVEIAVEGMFQGESVPMEGLTVYLFSDTGAYRGISAQTDATGRATFNLPELAYKVRAYYKRQHYWSDVFTWQNTTVEIPMADAEVMVSGAGLPLSDVYVYVFSESDAYMGLALPTDSEGKVVFRLPEGVYKFRADYQGTQYWSTESSIQAHAVTPVAVSTGGGTFNFSVLKDAGVPLTGVNCYVFNDQDNYLGMSGATDSNGEVSFNFSDGLYKFRVDYMGTHFWSDVLTVPDMLSAEMLIAHETVDVLVETSQGPVEGVMVYLFSESSSYLNMNGLTDANGIVSFDLPVGMNFMFRADYMGNLYWSDINTITLGGTNNIDVDTGGGLLQVDVKKGAGLPMEGINVYLFSPEGAYRGMCHVTDADGRVVFGVPEAGYKVRVDYQGEFFWSEPVTVLTDTTIEVVIPHQDVEITAEGLYQGSSEPMEGLGVYLFSESGVYKGQYAVTDANGHVIFNVPDLPYKVRVDYLGKFYWSDVFTWQDITVDIPMADAEVWVSGAGLPHEDIAVYVFSASNVYQGFYDVTDSSGRVLFHLPQGAYTFRADHQGFHYWSDEASIAADIVNPVSISTGGGTVSMSVFKGVDEPLTGVNCYVFNSQGAYLGLNGVADTDGRVSFDLSDGSYKFRVDYMGAQFWSDVFTVPDVLSAGVLIDHETAEVMVETPGGPVEGLNVYAFSETGSYLGINAQTDAAGIVSFDLPSSMSFLFRADYMGNLYWSDLTQVIADGVNQVEIITGGGLLEVTVQKETGLPLSGLRTYLFSESGKYLGKYGDTDMTGIVRFNVPEASYKVRVDYQGAHFWSDPVTVSADTSTQVDIPHQDIQITVQGSYEGILEPMEGLTLYLFSDTGAYKGISARTDADGRVVFNLPDLAYKVRTDYLGAQYFSEVFQSQDATVTINKGVAGLQVQRAGSAISGADVYLFSETDKYLGVHKQTDAEGFALFMIPAGTYKFRVDQGGNQNWTEATNILPDMENNIPVELP